MRKIKTLLALLMMSGFIMLAYSAQLETPAQESHAPSLPDTPQNTVVAESPAQPVVTAREDQPTAQLLPPPPKPAQQPQVAIERPVPSEPPSGYKGDIFGLHNQYRQSQGLALLTYDHRLGLSAQEKADDMCANQYFSHDRPDGEKMWVVIAKYSDFSTAGENLARGFSSPERAMAAWYNSPTHLANIVRDWQMVGVGVTDCATDGNVYVAVHFKNP